jgi:hypothetical protein
MLVSEAFIRGGRCFLDKPEWQAFLREVVESETKSSKGSKLGILVDRAFIEVSCCPRWLMETRMLLEAPPDTAPSTSIPPLGLLQRMRQSRDTLSVIQQQLEIALSRQGTPVHDTSWEDFIGPIAFNFIGAFAQSAMNGIRLAVALLDHLIGLVGIHLLLYQENSSDYVSSSSSSSVSGSPRSFIVNPWSDLGSHGAAWQLDFDPDYGLSLFYMTRETSGWMDRMMMSMGLLGVRPRVTSQTF